MSIPHLPLSMLLDLRDGFRSGEIRLVIEGGRKLTPLVNHWLAECNGAMLTAFETELKQRRPEEWMVNHS